MIANYHTHTPRCRHAQGDEALYVRNALERGLKIFGFSDHTPQFFPGDYYSFMRMYPEELPGYCDTIRNLQQQYRHQLEIPLGLEAEYYPGTWKELLPRLQDAGIEYLILGQHWLGNEQGEHGSGGATTDETLLRRYVRQVITGLETGKFSCLAHPDLFRFVGEPQVYHRHMRELCRFARQADIPLEINFYGIRDHRRYPDEKFWGIAGRVGNKAVFGFDSHDIASAYDGESIPAAMELVKKYNLNLIENPKIVQQLQHLS